MERATSFWCFNASPPGEAFLFPPIDLPFYSPLPITSTSARLAKGRDRRGHSLMSAPVSLLAWAEAPSEPRVRYHFT